jgi:succinyl-CoA synthetase alpha subunit
MTGNFMNILLPKNAKILGQGLTGGEGSQALPKMLEYGTNIVAGVTPGKGGQELQGVPIFNTVEEALKTLGMVDGVVQFVPPLLVKTAAFEALEAGVKFLLIGAEKVPTKDAALIYAKATEMGATVIGPNSVGLICPERKLRLGFIGGFKPERVFVPGNIAIVSKSGSMTAEIGLHLKNHDLGVSWAVGIGGDRIIGTDFADFLLAVEEDPNTQASVIFGELGGTYEERVAELVKSGKVTKPVVAFIAGEFTLQLPSEVQFGHAGAIIEGSRGLPDHKRQVLKESGVKVADDFDQIADLVKASL